MNKRAIGFVLLVLTLAGVVVLSVTVGSRGLPPETIWAALTHHEPALPEHLIVSEVRVPRTVIGLIAGMALGLAGAVVQGVTRNPLADPGILGVNAGAALFVVIGISVFGLTDLIGYVWFSFAGAAGAAVLVYLIGAMGSGGATPVKIALSGAALSAVLGAATTAVLLTDADTFEEFRLWQVGSLAGRGAEVAVQAAPFLLIGAVLALASARVLNALGMGDDVAVSWGQNVTAGRLLCGAAVVLLCGAATAMAGPIGFVGLVVPHMARIVTGPDHRWLLPYAMILAPVLLLSADVLGRIVAHPGEVQVGIVTAVIGAPVFVALARRRRLAEL
ncbi:FecCD family ABC transporter permease [Actinoplanes couchii]|uniref:Iron ABC transporter permease n=1 Tax=Actinoplanes couchii TaxID=403638 RepID=A0ABQ3X804_9ACTN|nr:iron chelate uptake ABC transporter family permease subunit [Actinoplanes couchii]MDR6320399.1 iron complex transport system permease protein [Actinoplanes couchii]GID54589.1 iron ABC transporter permease [Actinoplanes couchii]